MSKYKVYFSPACNVTELCLLDAPPPTSALGNRALCARQGVAGQLTHTAFRVKIAAAFLGSHLALCTESPGPFMCFDSVVLPLLCACNGLRAWVWKPTQSDCNPATVCSLILNFSRLNIPPIDKIGINRAMCWYQD